MGIVDDIKQLQKEKDALILAHNYQRPEIQEIADFCADSLELARKAAQSDKKMIIFCGVLFMAETAKILSPEKTVLIPRIDADCPMANMISADDILTLKKKYPEAKVVSYVNSTAEVKAVTDVCCTSANAVSVVQNIDAQQIIFGPDKNLASYCQRFVDKEIIPWSGYCYVHSRITREEVEQSKALYPDAVLLVHPECEAEVVELGDKVLSTSGMLRFAGESDAGTFLIATEMGLIYRLKKENPEKNFYPAGTLKTCLNMKKTSLEDVYLALSQHQHEITLSPEIIAAGRRSLEEMIRYV
jgi:quinolinate synthase